MNAGERQEHTIEEKEARTFIVLAITAALAGWSLAFKYGLAGQIPFDTMLTVWAAASAALLASLFWPRENSIINWRNRLVLLTPSLWFLVSWMDLNLQQFSLADELAFLVSLTVLFICVPYTVFLLLSITNREMFELKSPRLRVGLVIVVLIIYSVVYAIGLNHPSFITCEQFEFSGDFVPADCTPEVDLENRP